MPKELFASRPQTKWQKFVWQWANTWYKKEPADQCEYRKRKFHAFTWKPFIWFIATVARAIILTMVGFCAGLYVFIGSILIFLFGWRPYRIFENTWDALHLNSWTKWRIVMYTSEYRECTGSGYRLWIDHYNRDKKKYMPISGIEILWFVIFFITIRKGIILTPLQSWTTGTVFLTGLNLIGLYIFIYIYIKRFAPYLLKTFPFLHNIVAKIEISKQEAEGKRILNKFAATEKRRTRQEQTSAANLNFMTANFGFDNIPDNVDLKKLPKPRNVEEHVKRFYVAFWALKAKVCKPFAN